MLWLRSMPCQATLRWITLPKASSRPLVKDMQEDWRLPGPGNCVSIVCTVLCKFERYRVDLSWCLVIIPRSGIKVVRIGHAEKVSKRLEEVGANPYTMRGDAANRNGDRESHANRQIIQIHSNTFIILDIGHD